MKTFQTLLHTGCQADALSGLLLYNKPEKYNQGSKALQNQQAMNQFLAGIERRAFRMAEIATGNREDALELVQEAMLGLVQRYSDKQEAEWPPLFHRILQSRIRDWYRRNRVRNRIKGWLSFTHRDEEDSQEAIQLAADPYGKDPEKSAITDGSTDAMISAIKDLPLRQQQAFLLRNWEGMSVAETAAAMSCSQGSVKTHYSRAVHSLRAVLEDHWP